MKNRILGAILALTLICIVFPASAQFTEQGSSTDNWEASGRLQIGTTATVASTLRLRIEGGSAHHGLYAESDRAGGYALYGRNNDANGFGVMGLSSSGTGIRGWSSSGVGILGQSSSGLAGEFHGPVKMRNTSGTTDLFSFESDGAFTSFGTDPDITMNLSNSSAFTKLQLRFQVGGTTKGELHYDKTTDQLVMAHDGTQILRLDKNGGNYWMEVEHGIRTGRVQTDAALADYVFAEDYTYPTLAEVDSFIQTHHHLPGVVSQAEVDEQGGVDLTDFTVQLQEKLEELYLHVIEMDKRVADLEAENAALKEEIEEEFATPSNH